MNFTTISITDHIDTDFQAPFLREDENRFSILTELFQRHLGSDVFSYLSIHDFCKLSLTSKKWRNEKLLWRSFREQFNLPIPPDADLLQWIKKHVVFGEENLIQRCVNFIQGASLNKKYVFTCHLPRDETTKIISIEYFFKGICRNSLRSSSRIEDIEEMKKKEADVLDNCWLIFPININGEFFESESIMSTWHLGGYQKVGLFDDRTIGWNSSFRRRVFVPLENKLVSHNRCARYSPFYIFPAILIIVGFTTLGVALAGKV